MQAKDAVARVKAVDGTWETLGVDTMRGVHPEEPSLEVDRWGPTKASFVLRRDGRTAWPDLCAFTKIEIDIGGLTVWGGRISETPNTGLGLTVTVECKGGQYHLDDDVLDGMWVSTDLGAWKDGRAHPDADLASLRSAWDISTDGGLKIGFPSGVPADGSGLVYFDAGPGNTIAMIAWTASSSAWAANNALYVLAGDSFAGLGTEAVAKGALSAFTSAVDGWAPATPRRFVAFRIDSNGHTPSADEWFKLETVSLVKDASYLSGVSSVLTADIVAGDALDGGTLLLSTDRSRVVGGSDPFAIPELAPDGPRTPRQLIEAVNVWEDCRCAVDALWRPVFEPKPTVPDIIVGEWGGMEFEDASAGSAEEVYSRVIVTGSDAAGSPVRVERLQSQQPGVPFDVSTSPAATNPTFASNTTGWTATTSTITRDTSTVDADAASGRWDNTGASDNLATGDLLTAAFTGTFFKGFHYALTFRVRASSGTLKQFEYRWGALGTDEAHPDTVSCNTSFKTVTIYWTPQQTHTSGVTLQLDSLTNAAFFYVDALVVSTPRPTIVERQGFQRTHVLEVGFPLTTLSANRLGDKFLEAHRYTPFKGRLKLAGTGSARDYRTGDPVPLERLLLMYDGLVHFADRVNPDTGNWGRDGRIVQGRYDHAKDEFVAEIDNTRSDFERLLERLGVYVGQLR